MVRVGVSSVASLRGWGERGRLVDEVAFWRYRLIELLGRAGMGEVWRAFDTAANNRAVAMKLLPAQTWLPTAVPTRRTSLPRILQDVGCNLGQDRPQRPVAAKNSDHHQSAGLDRGHDD